MMQKCALFTLLLALLFSPASGQTLTREQIITNADRLADAQLKALQGTTQIDWVAGTFYAGLADYLRVSPKAADYRKAIDDLGQRVQWTPHLMRTNPLHADTLCIGMAFEEASADQHDTAILQPLKARLDTLADHLAGTDQGKRLTWWWCDSLFMSPRGLARMSSLTGDPKYINAMDKEWWRATALLYDPQEHLFFRDKSYFNKKTKDGHKVFWARGNGWVIAGLARVLASMPADFPARPKYIQLFKDMADRLAHLQTSDGTWHASLLDPTDVNLPETSGTSLICYAIAWGINNHILPKRTYLPVVLKAWTAMMSAERPDGLPGYAQPVGSGPRPYKIDSTALYSSGGYLLAATELLKLTPIDLTPNDIPTTHIPAP